MNELTLILGCDTFVLLSPVLRAKAGITEMFPGKVFMCHLPCLCAGTGFVEVGQRCSTFVFPI